MFEDTRSFVSINASSSTGAGVSQAYPRGWLYTVIVVPTTSATVDVQIQRINNAWVTVDTFSAVTTATVRSYQMNCQAIRANLTAVSGACTVEIFTTS